MRVSPARRGAGARGGGVYPVHRVREAKEALSPPPSLSTRLVGGWYREAVVRRLNTTHTRALTRAPRHGIDHLLLYAYE